jgi:hypothetical protein
VSFYRDVYLKSEDWKSLRKIKLSKKKARCQICGFASKSNDIHHLKYRNLYDVEIKDLVVVCRKCHDIIHGLMRKYPKLKTLDRKMMWKVIRQHLDKMRITRYNGHPCRNLRLRPEDPNRIPFMFTFSRIKSALVHRGIVNKKSMPWRDVLSAQEKSLNKFGSSPDLFIYEYIRLTGHDPRLNMLSIISKVSP